MGIRLRLLLQFLLGALALSLATFLMSVTVYTRVPDTERQLFYTGVILLSIGALAAFWLAGHTIVNNLRLLTVATRTLTASPGTVKPIPNLSGKEFRQLENAFRSLAKNWHEALNTQADKANAAQTHLRSTFERISQAITSVLNLDKLLTLVMDVIHAELRLSALLLYFIEEDHTVRFKIGRGVETTKHFSNRISQKAVIRLAHKQKAVIGSAKELFPMFAGDNRDSLVIAAPLKDKDVVHGLIVGKREEGAAQFSQKDLDIFATLTNQVAIAVQNSRFYEETQKLAITDGLTRAHNHRYFQEKLTEEFLRAEHGQHPLSLLMIDIDHFKEYNDTFGHPRGDEVLKEIAHILLTTARNTDVVARYGGEEFAVILPETPKNGALLLAERVLNKVQTKIFPGQSEESKTHLTVSIGVASFPREAVKAKDLIEKADQKLYQAKKQGRNQICFDESEAPSPILK